jgi:hypothetical protein
MGLDINRLNTKYHETKTAESEGSSSSYLNNFVRMPEGKGSVILRILPPAPDGMFGKKDNPFFQATRIHKVNGKSLHDPREKVNGRWVGENPIGDYLKWLWKESEQSSPDERDRMQALYRQLKPIDRYYYNVIVRSETDDAGNVKKNVGPKILSVGKTVHEAILRGICGDPEINQPRLGDVTDFKSGRDFKLVKTIRKSGENTYPNYESSHFLEESPAGDPDDCKSWMENLHDLGSLRSLKTSEELDHELMVHLGAKQETSSNFDPNKYKSPTAVTSSVATSPVPKVRVVEEEDVEEVVTSKVTKRVPAPTDDDDDDEMADKEFLEELRKLS